MLSRRTFLKTGAASVLAAGAFTNMVSAGMARTNQSWFAMSVHDRETGRSELRYSKHGGKVFITVVTCGTEMPVTHRKKQ